MSDNDDDDDVTKPDMTRIEDLSEFLHKDDPETNTALDIPPTPDQGGDDLDAAPPLFESEEVNFSSDSTQPGIEIPDELTSNDDLVDLDTLDEVEEIEELSQLEEEVESEIQEALEADDFGGDTFEESEPEEVFSMENEEEEEQDQEIELEDGLPVSDLTDVTEGLMMPPIQAAPETYTTPEPASSAPRENFKDLNEFGNSISYGQVTAGGNPPFSIILRRIKYLEDSQRIIEILREHELCDESNEADYQQGLNNGSMLISQLSEYSAIYLAHKFRRFDLEILLGLADEIHPSKNYDMDYKGLVRKENLRQNKNESFSLEDSMVEVEAILLATTPTLENYRIDRYLGLVSAHIMIDETEFQKLQEVDANSLDAEKILEEIEEELSSHDSGPSKTARIEVGLEEIYQNLAEALKAKAFKLKGNAVVGINYQITPLINQRTGEQSPSIRYKVSCTGNAVWVGGKEAPRSEA